MSTLAERPSTPIRNPLLELHAHGQSIWLDYIRRNLITSGELKRLVEEQAQGDYQALHQRGRRVLRVQLGRDTASGLRQIEETLGG